MTDGLNPSLALDTATALRAAARRQPFPAWFPPAVGIGYAASLSTMGIGYLLHGSAARIVSLTGAALVLLTFATTLPVIASWRRSGVVPKFDACGADPAWQRKRVWFFALAAIGAAIAMVLVVVGYWGWIEIAAGLVLGAFTWRRLARQR